MSDVISSTTCPICEGPLEGAHCKLMCRNCGYREDCSDLFQLVPVRVPVEKTLRAVPPAPRPIRPIPPDPRLN